MDRDEQLVAMIRNEIEATKSRAAKCGWHPQSAAWHRAFGELAGMHKILELIDPAAYEVDLHIPERISAKSVP